jgi:hypothetical protein
MIDQPWRTEKNGGAYHQGCREEGLKSRLADAKVGADQREDGAEHIE